MTHVTTPTFSPGVDSIEMRTLVELTTTYPGFCDDRAARVRLVVREDSVQSAFERVRTHCSLDSS